MLLTGAADSLWRGAEGLGARARGAARHTGAGPTSALPGPAPIDGRWPSKSLRLTQRPAAAVRRPAWRLGCPSPTDAVSWTAGGRSPGRSRLLHPRRTSSPNVFSKSSTRRIRKFPERQGSAARTPPPLAPGTRWAQAASRPVFWAPSPLSLIVPFASEKGDDAKDLPSGLLVRSADPNVMCPAQIAPEWGRVGGS